MKCRFFTIMLLLLTATFAAQASPVDMNTAYKAAQSFLNSKMGNCPEIELIDFAEKASFSNFYVFGNNRCFVIIAGDDCVHPVLGYSVDNAFGTGVMPENVDGWLKAYNDGVSMAVTSKMEATADIKAEWARLLRGQGLTPKTRASVAPLVKTTWNQTAPYNNLCPVDPANDSSWYNGHTPTGCMATAMAQILNYWEHPVRGVGSHSYIPANHPEYGEQYADFGATVYDWDNMKNSYSDGYTEEEANAVATLMYHCGVSIDMNYSPLGSSGDYSTETFKTYFNYNLDMYAVSKSYILDGNVYSFYSDEEWIAMLKVELNLYRPLCYLGGHYISEEENGNHAFVCDGYDENNLFHFNWGWGGGSDGYYAIGALNAGNDISQNFNQYNAFLCNCFPCTPSINPPDTVSTTVSGRNVSIQWSSVDDASSYKLYRNGDLLASNLTATCFTDNNLLYGTYSYYVKSVMADGTMSLMSDLSIAEVILSAFVPTNLQAIVNNQDVSLSWTAPVSDNYVLSYGEGPFENHVGYGGEYPMYWAQRYPVQMLLDNVAGMAINKISVYSIIDSIPVIAYIYKGDAAAPEELLYQTSKILDDSGWQDINVFDPVPIDYLSDLWIVLYADTTVVAPAAYCPYSGPGLEDALYISLDGTNYWRWEEERSWMIRAYATDGTFTYNLYRNGNAVANNLSSNTYTDSNLPDDHYVYYVTTNYTGGESSASNEVEVMIGNPQYTVSTTASPSDGGSVSGGGIFCYGQTCTLTAAANTNYIFLNWTENNNVISSDATITFVVTESSTYTANFIITPSGLLNGVFSVGDSKQVRFSQGNLQYQASTDTWRFSDNQWDFVGVHNANISSSYSGWIDLFSWGTSGYDHGAVCYQPWSTSMDNNDYYAYNDSSLNLYDETGQADWGANPIVNGGNTSNLWRTLTYQEWQYLFNTRPGIRFAKAIVNNSCGVILLPDNWNEETYSFNCPNNDSVSFSLNVIDAEDWGGLENAGAVFLPAGGVREGNTVSHVGFYTGYWSASHCDYWGAFCVHIFTEYINPGDYYYRNLGYAVRLVSDCSDISQTINMSKGWNWWSSYIELSGIDGLSLLEESLGENGVSIKSQNAYVEYSSQNGWTGTLQAIDNESCYKIMTTGTCTLVLSGPVAVSANHPITLNQGWNWIGNPVSEAQTVTSALSGFTPEEGDIIKGQDAYATYSTVTGWTPSDFTLNPGEGYMYYSAAAGTKTLIINQVGKK